MSGTELKIKRIRKRIKAIEIATVLKVSNSYISSMECNKKPIPLELLVKWVKYLDEN